jgi:DNA primase
MPISRSSPDCASRLRNIALDRAQMRTQLSLLGLEKVVALAERAITHKSDKFAEPDTEASEVEAGWQHAVELHEAQAGLKRSRQAADQQADLTEETLSTILEFQERLTRGSATETDNGR